MSASTFRRIQDCEIEMDTLKEVTVRQGEKIATIEPKVDAMGKQIECHAVLLQLVNDRQIQILTGIIITGLGVFAELVYIVLKQ